MRTYRPVLEALEERRAPAQIGPAEAHERAVEAILLAQRIGPPPALLPPLAQNCGSSWAQAEIADRLALELPGRKLELQVPLMEGEDLLDEDGVPFFEEWFFDPEMVPA